MARLLVWANPLNEPDYGVDRPSWDPLLSTVSNLLYLLLRNLSSTIPVGRVEQIDSYCMES